MSRTKKPASTCIGYANGDLLIACASPSIEVGRGGRCSRCDQLHRRGALARADQFPSINDTVLPGEPGYTPPPVVWAIQPATPEGPAPPAWTPQWPHCLACGLTESKHDGGGICARCSQSARWARKQGRGVVILWLPFAADDPARYNLAAVARWTMLRDLGVAARYLERRAAAGGIPTGGKVIIRATKDAHRLPERVIRPVAA